MGDVGDMIWDLMDANTFPEPDDPGGGIIYLVLMPPESSGDSGTCGAHQAAMDIDGFWDLDLAWVGYSAYMPLDGIMQTLSHELVEIISDPEDSGYKMTRTIDGGREIGDACNDLTDILGGVSAQAYWSNRQRACVMPRGRRARPSNTAAVASLARTPDQMDVLWIDQGGLLKNAAATPSWFPQWPYNWHLTQVPGAAAAHAGKVAVVSRASYSFQSIWIGQDGSVRTVEYNGQWLAPTGIPGAGAGVPFRYP